MFLFKIMQKLPEQGIEIPIHGLKVLVLRSHMEIRYVSEDNTRILRIQFVQSKANYGNSRYWMRCPNPKCLRRCGKLYLYRLSDGMPVFVCRTCLNLAYRSQNKTALDRLIDKKWAIIRKLGADSDLILDKPKWMHWKTFYRLRDQIEALHEELMIRGIAKFSGLKGFASLMRAYL